MLIILILTEFLGSRFDLWSTAFTNNFTDVVFYFLLGLSWMRFTEGRNNLRLAAWAPWGPLLFAPEQWILDRLHVQGHREEHGRLDAVRRDQ